MSVQAAASKELRAEGTEAQSRMLTVSIAVPPLAWQLLTPQLFSLLAQHEVNTFPCLQPLKKLDLYAVCDSNCLPRCCHASFL
jgi:hypothetical protein